MKKLLISSLIATSTMCIAEEEITHQHCFSPKVFYRHHEEQNYKYKTSGIGFQYCFHKPKGLNIKLSALTNLRNKYILVEHESTLFFRIPIFESHNLYPVLASKSSSHKIDKVGLKSVYIHKTTGYVGMGWEMAYSPLFQFRVEGSLFRDLHNALMVQERDSFWGKSYSNPKGARVKVGFESKWKDHFFVEVDCYYAKTFQDCYKECGTEIAFKWGF